METNEIMILSSTYNPISMENFEEIFLASMRRYSIRHLPLTHEISQDNILKALQKSLKVCQMAGIDGTHHFKKVYVYDANVQSVQIEWQMTKKGLNLMAMHTPELNERMARWLCQMADL
jgi:hypothetical protein